MTLLVCSLFPLATVAAGDQANGDALVRRARQRGIDAEHITAHRSEDVPSADVFVLGGAGRDGVGNLVGLLDRTRVPERVMSGEAVMFAVDSGVDAISRRWVGPDGALHPGVSMLAAEGRAAKRSLGTVATRPAPALGLPAMVGWISADVVTVRHAGVAPLVELVGGPRDPATDGVVTDHVVATRLHGPVLALNPELSDLLLGRAVGCDGWPPLEVESVRRARAVRLAELTNTR
jgi:lipid II isoglutaminyl synthase (glutamine-hydrolysing)